MVQINIGNLLNKHTANAEPNERKVNNMKKVFICSPYRGDIERNTKLARKFGRHAAKCGYVPVIPHLVFPQFLDDNNPEERILGITMGAELLKSCDMIWIVGNRLSKGMQYEVEAAKKHQIPVRCYDTDFNRIYPETMSIDDRIDDAFAAALNGVLFD